MFYFIPLEISEEQTNIENKSEISIPTKHVISLDLINDKNNINNQNWFLSSMPHNSVGSNRLGSEVLFTKDLSCILQRRICCFVKISKDYVSEQLAEAAVIWFIFRKYPVRILAGAPTVFTNDLAFPVQANAGVK